MKSNVKFKIIIWVYNGMLKARLQLYIYAPKGPLILAMHGSVCADN